MRVRPHRLTLFSSRNPQSGSSKLIEIGVGCRTPQRSAHSDDFALVVKGMGQNMVKDECRSANGDFSVGEMKFLSRIELLIRQTRQIGVSLPADFLLEVPRIGDRGTLGRVTIDVRKPL